MSDFIRYEFRAARADGGFEVGSVEATSRDDAAVQIAQRRLFIIELAATTRRTAQRRHMGSAELALGLRILASLFDSGLPANRALDAFDELAPPAWKSGLPAIHAAIREGKGLAAAFEISALAIPPLIIGIVRAGEAGSGLGTAIRRAAAIAEQAASLRSGIRSALAYPSVLALAGMGSVSLLVGIVLPRFAEILADVGQALPATTRIVLSTAQAIQTAFVPSAIAVTTMTALWFHWIGTAGGRQQWHGLLLGAPVVGEIRLSTATGGCCAALAGLLDHGVPIATALFHAANASGDAAIAARLVTARESVVRGASLSRALQGSRALSATAIRLIGAGETSGRVAEMLAHAARIESEQAQLRVRSLVRLLEPAIILLFGALVALVSAALLQAVYGVRPAT